MKAILSFLSFLLLGTTGVAPAFSQNRFNAAEHPIQIGIVVDPFVLSFSPRNIRVPTALVLKHHFHPKNSFNVYLSYGNGDGLTNYRSEHRYRFNGFNAHMGYEHSFFATRRFNFLTGASLGYIYSKELLHAFRYRSVLFPDRLKFHSEIGPGVNLGLRFNVNKRFGLESNMSALYVWPMPYNESFKGWIRNGRIVTHRGISLEGYYRF